MDKWKMSQELTSIGKRQQGFNTSETIQAALDEIENKSQGIAC